MVASPGACERLAVMNIDARRQYIGLLGYHDELMTAMNDFVCDYIRQTPFISVTSPRAVDAVVPTRTTNNCYG